jgi:hypothetical protein
MEAGSTPQALVGRSTSAARGRRASAARKGVAERSEALIYKRSFQQRLMTGRAFVGSFGDLRQPQGS